MKQLTLTSINKAHSKEFNSQKKVVLKTGDYIMVQEKFKTTSIQKLLLDYQDILEQLSQKEVSMEVIKDMTFVYYMLLLRHFTNLNNIPNEIDKMVIVCEKLIDLNLLEEILSAFDKEELRKVDEMIKQVSENSKFLGEQIGDIFAKAALNEVVEGEKDADIQ
ncbi:hypothetical protein [Paenibacillus elgii]|uniref:hypothetical protein n=1 Tax=Paenibacillus elgii TaxID=189691 RepID=UPI00203ED54B|nr:hypothetical protein [Paenibacillus elgii]MCM3273900.1 hypothetical protein [Paenibacillus elgii]